MYDTLRKENRTRVSTNKSPCEHRPEDMSTQSRTESCDRGESSKIPRPKLVAASHLSIDATLTNFRLTTTCFN